MYTVRLIQSYYLGSPLFLLLGVLGGVELRALFLPSPGLRFAYYAFLSGLGLLAYFRPRTAPWVALGESSLNLFLLMGGILVPYFGLADQILAGKPLGLSYTPGELLRGGVLAGSVFLLGFYRAQETILRSPRRGRQTPG